MNTKEAVLFLVRLLFSELPIANNYEELRNVDWNQLYESCNKHAIAPLLSFVIPLIPDEFTLIKKQWKNVVYSNVYHYSRIVMYQKRITNAYGGSRRQQMRR